MPKTSSMRKVRSSGAGVPIIICDDHIAIRTGLTAILENQQQTVVGGCDTVEALVGLVEQYPNAVVITDLAVDDVPFPLLVRRLREQSKECQIVVYSMRDAPATIRLCYNEGAIAYVPKRAEPEEIVKAVISASHGERYLPALVASELASVHIDRNTPQSILSSRDFKIFLSYANKVPLEEIASKFEVSDKRIQNLLTEISKKLNVPRSSFYELALKHGLVDPP